MSSQEETNIETKENEADMSQLIWNGEEYVQLGDYIEEVDNEKPTTGNMKKEELAQQILIGLLQFDDLRITPGDYDRIAKEVKKINEVSAAPSLHWMMSKNFMVRVKRENKRAFYMVTKEGCEFAEFEAQSDKDEENTPKRRFASLDKRTEQITGKKEIDD